MNIFVTDPDPVKSADALDNVRVNKMILESAQMLAVAMRLGGAQDSDMPVSKTTGLPYRSSHVNHPCTVWARQTKANYNWLYQHLQGLCRAFRRRYAKDHYVASQLNAFAYGEKFIPDGELTEFANCSTHKGEGSVVTAYRKTMVEKWFIPVLNKRFTQPKWSGEEPEWLDLAKKTVKS